MKALKTIVATAVIVLALTTVAMAGARHVGSSDDAATQATSPAATQTHQAAGVTLTDDQFARVQRAVNGQAAKRHTTQTDHDMSRDRARDHSRQKASDSAVHVNAQQRTQTHDGDGTHEHGAQSSSTHRTGTHDGGATHHDGGAHNGGTHHGGTHNGGTHHE
jgi:hypothetical protein